MRARTVIANGAGRVDVLPVSSHSVVLSQGPQAEVLRALEDDLDELLGEDGLGLAGSDGTLKNWRCASLRRRA